MTFGSVMNNELRIELLILYLLFYPTETRSAEIKFLAFLQAVLLYGKKAINCKCVI